MVKCPKCGEDIGYLRDFSPTWREFRLTIGENGLADYEDVGNDCSMDSKEDEYGCPKCGQILFTNEEEALNFLKG